MSVELPKDAEGREIPLDTEVLYQQDGKECKVIRWELGFCPHNTAPEWGVYLVHNGIQEYCSPERLYLTPPDSWEKLLEDLDKGADKSLFASCVYFDMVGHGCSSCPAKDCHDNGKGCAQDVMRDIAARIRKLKGVCTNG